MSTVAFTAPGMSKESSEQVVKTLDQRLLGLIDLALTLKHVHWNVVGPHFIGVHEMLDPQVDAVREMVDELAERIATLGGTPIGTPGYVAENRSWDDYELGKATVVEHLGALDVVYRGVIEDHRAARQAIEELDPITEDMIVGQIGQLEQFHWFVRAHLEDSSGHLVVDSDTEKGAAKQAANAF
jgi:starvation-inducible DNA-binding protein